MHNGSETLKMCIWVVIIQNFCSYFIFKRKLSQYHGLQFSRNILHIVGEKNHRSFQALMFSSFPCRKKIMTGSL